ncbi:hypothetical protein C8R43DRAFT_1243400 [Mycena crocata]|nr:hypothetical protein C8R43DRAFT_1243400 [Mycena crocata]
MAQQALEEVQRALAKLAGFASTSPIAGTSCTQCAELRSSIKGIVDLQTRHLTRMEKLYDTVTAGLEARCRELEKERDDLRARLAPLEKTDAAVKPKGSDNSNVSAPYPPLRWQPVMGFSQPTPLVSRSVSPMDEQPPDYDLARSASASASASASSTGIPPSNRKQQFQYYSLPSATAAPPHKRRRIDNAKSNSNPTSSKSTPAPAQTQQSAVSTSASTRQPTKAHRKRKQKTAIYENIGRGGPRRTLAFGVPLCDIVLSSDCFEFELPAEFDDELDFDDGEIEGELPHELGDEGEGENEGRIKLTPTFLDLDLGGESAEGERKPESSVNEDEDDNESELTDLDVDVDAAPALPRLSPLYSSPLPTSAPRSTRRQKPRPPKPKIYHPLGAIRRAVAFGVPVCSVVLSTDCFEFELPFEEEEEGESEVGGDEIGVDELGVAEDGGGGSGEGEVGVDKDYEGGDEGEEDLKLGSGVDDGDVESELSDMELDLEVEVGDLNVELGLTGFEEGGGGTPTDVDVV